MYETVETCPEELLLFFHRIPYTHVLKSGKTLIQHIYDTHFLGVEQVEEMLAKWQGLADKVDPETLPMSSRGSKASWWMPRSGGM